MQAIQTKFIPCTNFRPSRVKARAEAGSISLEWDHALNVDENHEKAANALCAKLGWNTYGKLIGGNLPGGGYSFVFQKAQKRLFVWAAIETKISRTYGGSSVKARIWEVVDGKMDIVASATWCTRSYKGEESEVMNALEVSGIIVGDEYKGYFSRYEMPIQIMGA